MSRNHETRLYDLKVTLTMKSNYNTFESFMSHENDEDPVEYLFNPEKAREAELTNKNSRIVLSFGGGSLVEEAFFPNIFEDDIINPSTDDETDVKNIFIIAFDETFKDYEITEAFRDSIVNHLSKLKKNKLSVNVMISCIGENIPICKNRDIIVKNSYRLQTQEGATFDNMDHCDVGGPFAERFNEFIGQLNANSFNLYVHNDAWFDTVLPFGVDYKVRRIQQFGSNFETLTIVPDTLRKYYNKSNVFMIRGNRFSSSLPVIVPFFSPEAIRKYHGVDFTNGENLTKLGLGAFVAAAPVKEASGGAGASTASPRHGGKRTMRRRRKLRLRMSRRGRGRRI